MKIGVFGSAADETQEMKEKAYEIGKAIAESGAVLVNGGCKGLPYAAARGCFNSSGKVLAYTPAKDLEQHESYGLPNYKDYVFTPEEFAKDMKLAQKYRNVISTYDCDAGIIIGGRIGTLNEFTNLFDMGKVVGILRGSGGTSGLIPEIVEKANKERGCAILFDPDPKILVKKVVDELNTRGVS